MGNKPGLPAIWEQEEEPQEDTCISKNEHHVPVCHVSQTPGTSTRTTVSLIHQNLQILQEQSNELNLSIATQRRRWTLKLKGSITVRLDRNFECGHFAIMNFRLELFPAAFRGFIRSASSLAIKYVRNQCAWREEAATALCATLKYPGRKNTRVGRRVFRFHVGRLPKSS